ncbi:hypothetical protein BC941DRAFT_430529 [Chlamydoabsidia padenii]|nr:hypothetical protein BC941DRAFT_430529 [Chlamydoabsidia padenii]
MVQLRCHHLQNGVNQQVLQQWKALLRSAQCQNMRPVSLTRHQSFSTQSKQGMTLNNFVNDVEAVTKNTSSSTLEQQKRQLRKKIPPQITSQVNQHTRSPMVLSIHTYLQRGEYDTAWSLMNQVSLQRQSIPSSTAQQLLEALQKQVQLHQSQLNGHNRKLQSLYLTRLDNLVNYLQISRMTWEKRDMAIIFDIFGRLDRVERAEVIFRNWDRHTKQSLTTDSFNKMLSMYFRRFKHSDTNKCMKLVNKMDSLFQSMSRRGCSPDITTYNWILAAKIKMDDFEGADNWYHQHMAGKGDRTTYHLMLQGAMKNSNTNGLVNADGWMDRMVQAGLTPNRNTFKHLLNGLSEQVAQSARMQNYDEMLRLSGAVKRIFGVMRKLNHKPDTALLNTLLKCYTITNEHDEIDIILQKLDMPQQQLKASGGCSGCGCQSSPSPKTNLNVKKQQKTAAKRQQMVKKYPPDLFTFNTLIHYELKNDRINNGLNWYDDMVRANIQPDTVTYGTFIGYYIQKENVDEALRYYDAMERKGIPGNATIYNMLLVAAQQQSTLQESIMERHRGLLMNMVDQDVVSYNIQLASTISGVTMDSDTATATAASQRFADVFDRMLAQDVIPNERTYNIALDIYGKLSRHHILDNTIGSIMSSIATSHLRPDTITYAINIRNAIYQHNLALGESLLSSMMDAGVKPNTYVFAHLMVGYVQEGDLLRARALLSLMTEAPYHVKPTAHVFAPLVKGYAENGDFDQAYSVFKDMLDQGVQPDIATYTILADMFVEHGSPKEAIRLLSGLKDRDISNSASTLIDNVDLDVIALGLLMEAHGLAGQSSTFSPPPPPPSSSSSSSLESTTPPTKAELSPGSTPTPSPHFTTIQEIYASITKPSPIINAIYLTAMARLRQPAHAWGAWNGMVDRRTIHYNALLFGLTQDRAWYPTAKQVFDSMATNPDGITFDAMIDGAVMYNDLSYICTHLWSSPLRPKPSNDTIPDNHHAPTTYMLVKTYYKILKAALYCQDYAQARQVYQEFLTLPNIPASATVWKKELHLLALANGLTDKVSSSIGAIY